MTSPKKKKTLTVNTRMPEKQVEEIDQLAEKNGRNRTKEISEACRYWISINGKPEDCKKYEDKLNTICETNDILQKKADIIENQISEIYELLIDSAKKRDEGFKIERARYLELLNKKEDILSQIIAGNAKKPKTTKKVS